MENFLALLPLLACPIGMGLLMWLMMPKQAEHQGTPAGLSAPPAAALTTSSAGAASAAAGERPTGRRWSLGGLCLDGRVLAGLAAIGVAVWVAAPDLVWAALPLLLLAACPLSMLLMMRGMRSGHCATSPAAKQSASVAATPAARLATLTAQQADIAREIAALEAADAAPALPAGAVALEARG